MISLGVIIALIMVLFYFTDYFKVKTPILKPQEKRYGLLAVLVILLSAGVLAGVNAFTAKAKITALDKVEAPQDKYLAMYYSNDTFKGLPLLVKNDEAIDFNWPGAGVKPIGDLKWYSVRWKRNLYSEKEGKVMKFAVITDNKAQVIVNDTVVNYDGDDTANFTKQDVIETRIEKTYPVKLKKGNNTLIINFKVYKLDAFIKFRMI